MAAETSMDVLGVDHVDLTVNALPRSIPFYEKILGALAFRRVPHATYVVWANAHLAIGLRPAERDAAFDRYRVRLHHLAPRGRSRAGVDCVPRRLGAGRASRWLREWAGAGAPARRGA